MSRTDALMIAGAAVKRKAKNGSLIPQKKCDNPIEQQFALGRAVGVRGTPSLILENGQLVPGYVQPLELLEILEGNKAG